MLHKEVKTRIDDLRDILMGNLPLPSDQIELITIGLIYKFMHDQDMENKEWTGEVAFFKGILAPYNWAELMSDSISAEERVKKFETGIQLLATAVYRDEDGNDVKSEIPEFFRSIFQNTFLKFRDGRVFKMFLDEIDKFSYDNSEDLGNAFEYLLMTMGTQAKNGQFRTPRNIIDFITEVVDPSKEDTILDPACGTAGFLISAYKHIQHKNTKDYSDYRVTLKNHTVEGKSIKWGDQLTAADNQQIFNNIVGYDNTPLMVRLSKVNMYLHQFNEPKIHYYDTLSTSTRWSEKYSCILANPPFMTPKGGIEPHDEFKIAAKKAEVLFADYILEHLTPDGKAGFIVPEGIVFQSQGDYTELRKWAIYTGGLYAVVSLPAGVFNPYSGVKTSVILIDRALARKTDKVLLVKVENDGFSLNTNRDAIKANDLPEAYRILTDFRKDAASFSEDMDKAAYDIAFNVVPKPKFAALEEYKASSSAWAYCEKSLNRANKAVAKYEEQQKENPKFEKAPEKFQEKLVTAISTFIKETKYQFSEELDFEKADQYLPPKTDFKDWFKEHLKKMAIDYGVTEDQAAKEELTKGLVKYLNSQRDYSLRFEQEKSESLNSNYELIPVGEIIKLKSGDSLTRKNFVAGDYLVYGGNGVTGSHNKYNIEQPTIIIGRVGENCGAVHLTKPKGWITDNALYAKEFLIDINLKYLLEILRRADLNQYAKKGGQPSISQSTIYNVLIPIPPDKEQTRLVTQIQKHQKIIEGCDLIINNYAPAFEIREEWEWMPLGDLFKTVSGATPKRSNKAYFENGSIHWVKTKDLENSDLYETEEKITEQAITESSCRILPIGTVLVAMYGGFNQIGRTGILRVEAATNQAITALYPNDEIMPEYLNYALIQLRDNWKKVANSTRKDPNITRSDVLGFMIPVPPFEVQQKIVTELAVEKKAIESTITLKTKMEAKIKGIIDKVWGLSSEEEVRIKEKAILMA